MNTQSEIAAKIASLKAYSISKNAKTGPLFVPLETAMNTYFSEDKSAVSAACEDVIKYMYNDISRRTTIFEHQFDMHLATNFPVGYDDISKCFAEFSEIMNISNSTFYSGFVFGPDPETGITGPLSNSYIDKWVAEFTAAISGDVNKVQNLAEWCKNSGGSCDVINLLEDKGEVVSQLTKDEIVNKIYIEKNLLNIIKLFGLSTYIPTWLQG